VEACFFMKAEGGVGLSRRPRGVEGAHRVNSGLNLPH
jgi:hypothetical protein